MNVCTLLDAIPLLRRLAAVRCTFRCALHVITVVIYSVHSASFCYGLSTGPADGIWSQGGYDQQRTSRSHLVGPRQPRLLWTSEASGLWSTTPAVGPDGTIITPSYNDGGSLVAISPQDGSTLWTFDSRDTSNATPALSADGAIYFGDSSGAFYRVAYDGTPVWDFDSGTSVWTSPLLRDDGSVVFTNDDYNNQTQFIRAVDVNGHELWRTLAPPGDLNSPILGQHGEIFAHGGGVGGARAIHAFSSDGELLWTNSDFPIFDIDHGAVGADGTVYYGSLKGELAAVDHTTGVTIWATDIGDAHVLSPAIASDGAIVAGAWDGLMRAYDPTDGSILWTFDAGRPVTTAAAIDANGVIYFAAEEYLFALNESGTERWRFELPRTTDDTAPVIADGVIYIAGRGSNLFAIANVPEPSAITLASILVVGRLAFGRCKDIAAKGGGAEEAMPSF